MNWNIQNGTNLLKGELVELSIGIVDADGQPIRQARFFEPKPPMDSEGKGNERSDMYYRHLDLELGERYGITIRLSDHSKRYLCCIGVDGRSVIDGNRIPNLVGINLASRWNSGNYVLNVANENGGTIEGWRESMDDVRRFIVTDEARSYAAEQWNDLSAVGTIVVSVFRELEAPTTRGIGTGYAEKVHSTVKEVSFHGHGMAYEVFILRYAPVAELKRLHVFVPQSADNTHDLNRLWPSKRREFCSFPK